MKRLAVLLLIFISTAFTTFAQGSRPITTYNVDNILYLDGVKYASAEIGATIATMYAALPANGGTIILPPRATCYTMSTAVTFGTASKPVMIDGSSGACINWTPTTGTAFTFNNGDLVNHYRSGGFRDIVINGPSSGTAIAIFLGGSNGAEGFALYGSKITWPFGTGIKFGDNTWGTLFSHSAINGVPAINFPSGLTNSGEDIELSDTVLQGGSSYTNCAIFDGGAGLQVSVLGGSFDDCQLTLSSGVLIINNTHFENPGQRADSLANPAIVLGGNSTINGLEIEQDASAGVTKSQEINVTGNTQVYLSGGSFTSNQTIARLLTNAGSNTIFMAPGNVGGFTAHSNTTSTGRTSEYPVYGLAGIRSCTQTSSNTFCNQLPLVTGTLSQATVEYCGATTGGTQACAQTTESLPLFIFGDVTLNAATSQSITTLPFTSSASYSCTGSDLTTAAGIVSFSSYAAASVTIAESGGANTDHLRYQCVGF